MTFFGFLLLSGVAAAAEQPVVPDSRLTEPVPWLRYFPAEARRAQVEGRVQVDCTVADGGRLRDCTVVSETPEGYGFGENTIKALELHGRVNPDSLKPGQRVRQPILWRIEE